LINEKCQLKIGECSLEVCPKYMRNRYGLATMPAETNDQRIEFQQVKAIDWLTCWTRVTFPTLEHYRSLYFNQLDITEIAPHLYHSFTVNCLQLLVTIAVLIYEESYTNQGLSIMIYILLLYHVVYCFYLRVNADLGSTKALLGMACVGAIVFLAHFVILVGNQTNNVIYQ